MEKFPNIPPYEILEELGRGSTGIVFKARHKESGRLVAVKTICPKPGPEGAIRITRFHREARAMAVCNHPNIVLVYAIGDCAGQPYIIREFVEGRSLQAELDKELFTARLASKMVELLSRPVQYIHDQGVIHRRLRPDNVLITQDGMVKLIGFGKVFFIGGSPPVSITTDIRDLGVMLYHLMTREYWFPEGRLPDILARICLKCSNVEPENQYHSAMELAEDLRRYLQGSK